MIQMRTITTIRGNECARTINRNALMVNMYLKLHDADLGGLPGTRTLQIAFMFCIKLVLVSSYGL